MSNKVLHCPLKPCNWQIVVNTDAPIDVMMTTDELRIHIITDHSLAEIIGKVVKTAELSVAEVSRT